MAITYTRISTTASGGQADSDSYSASVSGDGTAVAFYSFADNLVAGDTNATYDVFLKNLATGAVTRLSTNGVGGQANGSSVLPSLTPDGSQVAFSSLATNLVAGDTNGVADIFVKTLATGAVLRVSTDAAGVQANDASSQVAISPDGTKVAFVSSASNLVAGDTNGYPDLFVKNLTTGAVTRFPLGAAPVFSPDGTHVAFSIGENVYLGDIANGISTVVSTRGDGSAADGGSEGSSQPVFSPDGTKIAFQSNATFLVAGETIAPGIFVKDLTTGSVSRVSTSASDMQGDSTSQNPHFSPDGTQIVFVTFSDNLVAGTVLGATSIVVKDLLTGVVTLVAEINGQTTFDAGPQFTPDGHGIIFSTPASLVVADGNGASDIYIATLPAPPAGTIAFTSGAAASTPENTPTSTVVYTAAATDSVGGHTLTYILSGGPDARLFNIDATTGAITFKTAPDFEAPADGAHSNVYHVIVTATDGTRATGQPVAITVTDVNDNAPVFNSATRATVTSGAAAGSTAYIAHAVDADVGDAITYSLAGADAAKFAINATTGVVTFVTPPNYGAPDDAGANHVYDITVKASDGLVAHDALRAVQITVADPAAVTPPGTPTPVASTTLVSTNAAGVQGDAYSGVLGSGDATFSADGTRIAFVSWSDNLVPGDANSADDLFVKTLATGAVTRASTTSAGGQLTAFPSGPHFSPDGSQVVFSTFGAVFSGSHGDVALKDLTTGALTVVSSDAAASIGVPGGNGGSFSADGARIVFSAGSYNAGGISQSLTPGDTNLAGDVYIKTLATGAVILVSNSAAGEIGNASSGQPVFSPDGTKAAFVTAATNLFPGDANGHSDVVIVDLVTGVVTSVSVNADGAQVNADSTQPVFSPDGTKIAFVSSASNLVAGDTNGALDVFIKDLATGVVTRASAGNAGEQGNGDSYSPIFSADGTKLLFTSTASNFSIHDGNGASDAFVKDLATGGLTLVSVDSAGNAGNGATIGDAISADGSRVLYESAASNLAAGDVNGVSDVFLATLGAPPSAPATTAVVSSSAAGVEGNASSFGPGYLVTRPGFTADGGSVLFQSAATNLIAGDANGHTDLFLKTLSTGAVRLVDTTAAGVQANADVVEGAISADGSRVAFTTLATNLDAGAADGASHLYLKTLATGALSLISPADYTIYNAQTSLTEAFPAGVTFSTPAISSDGRYVAALLLSNGPGKGIVFDTATHTAFDLTSSVSGSEAFASAAPILFFGSAANLAGSASGSQTKVYAYSAVTNAFTLVSADASGAALTTGSTDPFASSDGSRVAFLSAETASGFGASIFHVYLKDLSTGALITVDTTAAGVRGNAGASSATVSADGTLVAFDSLATNLDPRATDGTAHVYVKNLVTGAVALADASTAGVAGAGAGFSPTIAPDGTAVAYVSAAANLVANDTNGAYDVFLTELGAPPAPPANTPPALAGATPGQSTAAGTPISPFSAVTVTDPDVGHTETVTVSFAAGAGVLSGGGFTLVSPGVYSVAAPSAAAAQADLRAASFTPTAGQAGTTTFTLTVSDGLATATDATTTVAATYSAPGGGGGGGGGGSGGGAGGPSASAAAGLLTEFQNLSRALATGTDAQTPGSPLAAQLAAFKGIASQFDGQQISQAQAETAIAHLVDGTTSVAATAYAFFTGFVPTAQGLNYLVHSTGNATDLNDGYYTRFSTENRYLNFAVNLATGAGAGASAFSAGYGALSLAEATAKAYGVVFGTTPDAAKVAAILNTLVPDGLGGQETRSAYFAQYGGDGAGGLGTKAAMVGFLLGTAVHDGSGVYGAADLNYLSALAHGVAPALGSELPLTYGMEVSLVGVPPVADPTVAG